MDIISKISIFTIFLPLIYSLYLTVSRLSLSVVEKRVLNFGTVTINTFALIFFTLLFCLKESVLFSLCGLSFKIDFSNINFLLFVSLCNFVVSLFLLKYFKIKKHFLFTKQSFFAFFGILVFNSYLYLLSDNLFSMLIFWLLQGAIVFCFSYFDIFRKNAQYSISRPRRLFLIGEFCFILLCLILYKYINLSNGYIVSPSINLDEINRLFGYISGIIPFEGNILLLACILCIIFSKFFIFPFNSISSFSSNASKPLYLTTIGYNYCIFSMYFLQNILFYFEFSEKIRLYLVYYLAFTIVLGLILLLFEKNFKIILAQFSSIINAGVIIGLFYLPLDVVLGLFFISNFILLLLYILLFLKDKNGLKRSIIPLKGHLFEKINILLFEKLPDKIRFYLSFIEKNVVQGVLGLIFGFLSFGTYKLAKSEKRRKRQRKQVFDNIYKIFLIFIIFILISIFLTLFGGF